MQTGSVFVLCQMCIDDVCLHKARVAPYTSFDRAGISFAMQSRASVPATSRYRAGPHRHGSPHFGLKCLRFILAATLTEIQCSPLRAAAEAIITSTLKINTTISRATKCSDGFVPSPDTGPVRPIDRLESDTLRKFVLCSFLHLGADQVVKIVSLTRPMNFELAVLWPMKKLSASFRQCLVGQWL